MLIVGGSFETGKPSGYINKLSHSFPNAIVCNGGTWEQLQRLFDQIYEQDIVFWMPEVDNSRPKLVDGIKKKFPHVLLVTSKRNDNEKYSFMDLVARALKTHSNLMLEISHTGPLFSTTILDPLGNIYTNRELDIYKVSSILSKRINHLMDGTRIGSRCIGDVFWNTSQDAIRNEFFEIVRNYANTFHELIHGANPSRMMGNASFRCENGFPSFRHSHLAFVSRRNIDKRDIDVSGFVPVDLNESEYEIKYWGPNKPSVDTPINIHLYNQFPKINFMLHSHTYIDNAPFTSEVLACGDLREYLEISRLVNDDGSVDKITVNLKGHGSFVGVSGIEMLRNIKYVARPVPEFQNIL